MADVVSAHLLGRLQRELKSKSTVGDDKKAEKIFNRLFEAQRDFVLDPCRRKALLCPRRSGKSYVAAAYLVKTCLERPKSNCLYLTLTRGSARGILWNPPGTGLKRIDEDFGLRLDFHNTNLQATFPNGSRITLAGADSYQQIDKFRGQAYDLVVIDECKSFPTKLMTELVEQVLGPALNDRMGTLAMIGTPGSILAGAFYEATKSESSLSRPWHRRHEWEGPFRFSFHTWSIQDNTALPHLWSTCLADKEAYGWSDENPIWRREYLGQWIADTDALVYRFKPERDTWGGKEGDGPHGLPDGHEWEYVLGCDLGFDDPFALVVVAFSETCPIMYQVADFKQAQLTVRQIAEVIRAARDKFGEFAGMCGDRGGLGKAIFAELAESYDLHLEPADKAEKRDYIELLNGDFIDGKIQLLETGHVAEEMQYNAWDETRTKEDKSCANDSCDAFLYTWRFSYHRWARPKVHGPEPGTSEFYKEQQRKELEKFRAAEMKKSRIDFMGELEDGLDRVEDFEPEADAWGSDWTTKI